MPEVSFEENKLNIDDKSISFDLNIYNAIVLDDKVVVMLDVPNENPMLDNIIAFDFTGQFLWTVQPFKERFPEKKIWMWTGYLFDNIPNKELLEYADFVVDGQFQIDKKDLRLKFRGSSNQRIWEKRNGEWCL